MEAAKRLATAGPRATEDGLPEAYITDLATRGEMVEVTPGSVLVRQGEPADRVYVVLAGVARVELDGKPVDPPITVRECIGELAVLDEAPRAASVIAESPMQLLSLAVDDFRSALDQVPGLRGEVTRSVTRRLRRMNGTWSALAVDADVLLEAYLSLQTHASPGKGRVVGVAEAAALIRRCAAEPGARVAGELDGLSKGEWRVAELVAEGLSNAAVAKALSISEHTVASHLKHIFTKVGYTSRVGLATAVLRSRAGG